MGWLRPVVLGYGLMHEDGWMVSCMTGAGARVRGLAQAADLPPLQQLLLAPGGPARLLRQALLQARRRLAAVPAAAALLERLHVQAPGARQRGALQPVALQAGQAAPRVEGRGSPERWRARLLLLLPGCVAAQRRLEEDGCGARQAAGARRAAGAGAGARRQRQERGCSGSGSTSASTGTSTSASTSTSTTGSSVLCSSSSSSTGSGSSSSTWGRPQDALEGAHKRQHPRGEVLAGQPAPGTAGGAATLAAAPACPARLAVALAVAAAPAAAPAALGIAQQRLLRAL
jgi:hypothetical protein